MALLTAGTSANNVLRALAFQSGGMSTADVATFNAALKYDTPPSNAKENFPESTTQVTSFFNPVTGQLFIPRRGVLKLFPGDFMLYDPATGFPFVISATAMATNPQWIHS